MPRELWKKNEFLLLQISHENDLRAFHFQFLLKQSDLEKSNNCRHRPFTLPSQCPNVIACDIKHHLTVCFVCSSIVWRENKVGSSPWIRTLTFAAVCSLTTIFPSSKTTICGQKCFQDSPCGVKCRHLRLSIKHFPPVCSLIFKKQHKSSNIS